MRVLITGGTGTISSGLVQECVNKKYETYALTRGHKQYRNIDGATYLYANLWDCESVENALGYMTFDVIVECLVYTIEQMKISLNNFHNKCDRYVFVSTAGIFDRSNGIIKEDSEKNLFEWKYTRDKIECECYLEEYSRNTSLKYTIIRPAITYGSYRIPFPVATRNPGWTFFQRLLDGKPMLACNNVKAQIVYIDDFAKAVVAVFESSKSVNEDYNVALNREQYWDDVIHVAANVLGVQSLIIHVPIDVFEKIYPQVYDEIKWNKSSDFVVSGSKIKQLTHIDDAKVSLEDGIKKIIIDMKKEHELWNRKLDENWNFACDRTILYAFLNNDLDYVERELLQKYFSCLDINPSEKFQELKKEYDEENSELKKIKQFYSTEHIQNEERIILYGYGKLGKKFAEHYKHQIIYIIDNKCRVENVYSFNDFCDMYISDSNNDLWVIASENYCEEFSRQVKQIFPNARIKKLF